MIPRPAKLVSAYRKNTAFKVALLYALFSVLWILFSDEILLWFVKDSGRLTTIQMLKGWFFVISTAVIIFFLLKKEISRLRRTEKILWSTLHATADGILVVSKEGEILAANSPFAEMWGIPPNFFENTRDDKKLLDYVLKMVENPVEVLERIKELYKSSGDALEEIRLKDGRVFERYSTPLIHDNREIGRVWSFHNLTNRKRAEEEKVKLEKRLLQAQKLEAIGTLAGGIAHDFNNILAAISGYTELANSLTEDGSRLRSYLNEALKGALRAKELVKQILRAGRIDTRELRALRAHEIIKETLALLRPSIPATIDIVTEIDPNCPAILADATQLHQVVMNICTNAYHAMREKGGILKISLKPAVLTSGDVAGKPNLSPGPHIKLSISDTGTGMTDDMMSRVFEPYYTTKAKGDGTGLGLAVVHGIVTSFHGDIYVSSTPGKGTTFDIFLPETPKPAETYSELKVPDMPPTGDERILLVEDDEAVAGINCNALEKLGYRITVKTNSLNALSTFEKDPDAFDLLITDMTMPQMTGERLAKKVLIIRPDMPIILCNGYSDLINEEIARNIGIRKFFMKPVPLNQLAGSVRRLLDERGRD